MSSSFYAFMARMKLINRWSLMRNAVSDNVAEHSHLTAILAHALAEIENEYFGGKVNADKVASIAVFHETAEVITGDLPTPIKYFNSEINIAYKSIEALAEDKLLSSLPDKLSKKLKNVVQPDKGSREYQIVKLADKLAALIKCQEEVQAGNSEFSKALKSTMESLTEKNEPCVNFFLENFYPAFASNLDDLTL